MMVSSWKVVEQFEQRMAEYCGADDAIAVDTCTWAIFLSLMARNHKNVDDRIYVPAKTYLGVATSVVHAGYKVYLYDAEWRGWYKMGPEIIDSACRLRRGMYRNEYLPRYSKYPPLVCLSFQSRKHLKIGRGGMILASEHCRNQVEWLRKARFLGRGEHNGKPDFVGWHAYMEPERAARGLQLMDSLPDDNPDLVFDYPDLREYEVLRCHV